MLHDIGMTVDYDDRHRHSRYLILGAGLPGFSPRETTLIAQAVHDHPPSLGELAPLAGPGDAALLDAWRRSCGWRNSSSGRATRVSAPSRSR